MELRTVISDQMIKYQLIDTRFDQISDDKHDIYLYGKLLTELLVQAANKSFRCFPCPCPCPWSMSMSKVHVFDLLFLIKNTMWCGFYKEAL